MKSEKVIYRVSYANLRQALGLPVHARVVQLFNEENPKDTVLVKVYGHGSMVEEGDLIPTIDWAPERDNVGLQVDTEGVLKDQATRNGGEVQ